MKPAYKARKPPVESLRPENAKLPPIQSKGKLEPVNPQVRNITSPNRFPPNRVILRNSKQKQIEGVSKMLSQNNLHARNMEEEDNNEHI